VSVDQSISRFRHVAPAGSPIPPSALAEWLGALVTGGPAIRNLEESLAKKVGVRHCIGFNTGRAALTVLLRSLRAVFPGHRDEVIVPSYTCYSVAASVVKAGLTPRLADIDPETLDFDYQRLARTDFRRVLAIVATNLYGLPNDLPVLTALARQHGVLVVDDAAQALGGRVGGRNCGTGGDAGLYSFDKGKNLSAINGGAIVTDKPQIADAIAADVSQMPCAAAGEVAGSLITLAAYTVLLPPRMYWIPKNIPALGLGRTVYTTDYSIARQPTTLAALALTMLPRLDSYTARRRQNAEMMVARLEGASGVQPIRLAPTAEPAYLRLPLLLEGRGVRDTAIHVLNRAGIGATGSYPTSIADINELRGQLRGDDRDSCGARTVAERILTLPTHPYVTRDDAVKATDLLQTVLTDARRTSVNIAAGVARVSAP
jgi:dTDP-4-amino-4,6-dideoxygalactose transaminase